MMRAVARLIVVPETVTTPLGESVWEAITYWIPVVAVNVNPATVVIGGKAVVGVAGETYCVLVSTTSAVADHANETGTPDVVIADPPGTSA